MNAALLIRELLAVLVDDDDKAIAFIIVSINYISKNTKETLFFEFYVKGGHTHK